VGRADTYSQPHAVDPILPDEVVLALARRHMPDASAVTEVDESGGEARAYLIDTDLVVKTQRPHRLRPRTSLAKEAYLLGTLAPAMGARIPRLLGYDRTDTAFGPVEYVCMSRMPGSAVRQTPISDAARIGLLAALGRLLRCQHAVPAGSDLLPRDLDWPALRQRLEHGFGDIADALAQRPHTWTAPISADEAIRLALTALPVTGDWRPVVLHSNPSPTHVFVDPATEQLTGLIDFGDAYASHSALDLHRWPAPADRILLRDAYLDGATPADDFDRVWTVAMVYADMAAIAHESAYAPDATADLDVRLGEL
jgi:hygromycin-B 7''-O-kinase